MANYAVKIDRSYQKTNENGETERQARWVQIGLLVPTQSGTGFNMYLDVMPTLDPKTGRPERIGVFPIVKKEVKDDAAL